MGRVLHLAEAYAVARERHLNVSRIDLSDADGAVETLAEIRDGLAGLASAGGGTLTVALPFAAHFGFAYLEAERLRARDAGVTLRLDMPTGQYTRSYAETIGFGSTDAGGVMRTSGSRTTIGLRRFAAEDKLALLLFLVEWTGKAQQLSEVDVGGALDAIGELFDNAFTHARSKVGVVSCGQFYPRTGRLHLSVVDAGIGIPASIAEAAGRREEEIDPPAALRWAFEEGTSSLGRSRGLGLARVQAFVARMNGKLHVISGAAYAELNESNWSAHRLPTELRGTILDLELPTPRGGAGR